jgi:hypothetical protein
VIRIHQLPPPKPGQVADDNFLSFLFGMRAAEAKSRYQLTYVPPGPDDKWYYYIKIQPIHPADKHEFTEARLALNNKTFLPAQVWFQEPNGNEVTWDFTKVINGADIRGNNQHDLGAVLAQVLPEDLVKYGLIPEFVGRLPLIATLEPLDLKTLINILTHICEKTHKTRIHTLFGGTHLGPVSTDQVEKTISALHQFDIERIGVSHCTGQKVSARMAHEFGDRFMFCNVGTVIEV